MDHRGCKLDHVFIWNAKRKIGGRMVVFFFIFISFNSENFIKIWFFIKFRWSRLHPNEKACYFLFIACFDWKTRFYEKRVIYEKACNLFHKYRSNNCSWYLICKSVQNRWKPWPRMSVWIYLCFLRATVVEWVPWFLALL